MKDGLREKKRRGRHHNNNNRRQHLLPAYKPSISPPVLPVSVPQSSDSQPVPPPATPLTMNTPPTTTVPEPEPEPEPVVIIQQAPTQRETILQQLTPDEQEQFNLWRKQREGTVAVNEPEVQQWKSRRIEELTGQVRQLVARIQQHEHADIVMPMQVKSACPNCDEVHAASYQLTINSGAVKNVRHIKQQLIKRGRSVRKRFVPDEPDDGEWSE